MDDVMLTLFGRYAVRPSAIVAMEGRGEEAVVEVVTLGGAAVRTVERADPYTWLYLTSGHSLCIEGRTLEEVREEILRTWGDAGVKPAADLKSSLAVAHPFLLDPH